MPDGTLLGPDPRSAWRISGNCIDLSRGAADTAEFDAEDKTLIVDPRATALVVVDMQHLFCGTPEAAKPAQRAVGPLQRLIPKARQAGVDVVWLNWGNRPDEANLPPSASYAFNRRRLDSPQPFLTAGSEDAKIIDELDVQPEDLHVAKYRLSGFQDTPLDSVLRARRISTLLFTGVNVDQCVFHSLADASFIGYDCILVEDCTATTSPDYCTQATLYNTRGMGFITGSEAVLRGLEGGRAGSLA